ncbi:MAG: glycosyltransferase family 4 protein [Candidatus Sumerlaeia bacterium]|nr:glycosyltransferase family 4 protein [Candidatus Sumerlaeia bacterium]
MSELPESQDCGELPRVLFIVDRVKHWSARAWQAVSCAAAWRAMGGHALVLVDVNEPERGRKSLPPSEVMKPELILEKARAEGLCDFISLPVAHKRPSLKVAGYWTSIPKLSGILTEQQVDVVHMFRRTHHMTACLSAAMARRPVAVVRSCTRFDRLLESGLPRSLLNRRLDVVTAFCDSMTTRNAAARGMEDARCQTIPPGLSPAFTERALDHAAARAALVERLGFDGEPLIGVMGAVESEKRLEHVVEAIRLLREEMPGVRLVLAGERQKRAGRVVSEQIESLGLGDAVRVVGHVPSAEVPGFVAGLDVAVYACTRSSGPSRSVLEYLSQGVPTVATPAGALREYHAREPRAFMLLEGADGGTLAHGIRDLWRDADRRREMSVVAAAWSRREFSYRALGEALRTTYIEALKRRGVTNLPPRREMTDRLIRQVRIEA